MHVTPRSLAMGTGKARQQRNGPCVLPHLQNFYWVRRTEGKEVQAAKKVIPKGELLFVTFRYNDDQFLLIDVPNTVTDVFWLIDEVADPSAIVTIEVCPSDDFYTDAINLSVLNERLQTVNWQNAIITE